MVLIFDIGKTNKKVFVFDANYRIIYEKATVLPETVDEDGFACENIELLTQWFLSEFKAIIKNPIFDIKAVNFSAYGASFVLIGKDGLPCAPLYNYLKPLEEKIKKLFYDEYGGVSHLTCETASPVLGNLNSGMQLFQLKKLKPKIFKKIRCALHLPQYFAYLLTQEFYSDITSIGCHTHLWNFDRYKYSSWVFEESIDKILAPLVETSDTHEIYVGEKKLKIGVGLHDSSAALIPYLIKFKKAPFILISTGTWCISFNPFNNSVLTKYELENDCLCYLSYIGNSVKAARYFGGNEHEQKVKILIEKYGVSADAYQSIKFDTQIVDKLKSGKKAENFEAAYHALMIEIVEKQVISTNLVLQNSPVEQIFVDGGFSKNDIYMRLLAQSFPKLKIYRAEVSEATALGAALSVESGELRVESLQLQLIT